LSFVACKEQIFAALALEREPGTGRLLLLPAPPGALCLINGLDPDEILASEDRSCELIREWYVAHIEGGGNPDSVAEEILLEVATDEAVDTSVLNT
jgi:hypothetical protein